VLYWVPLLAVNSYRLIQLHRGGKRILRVGRHDADSATPKKAGELRCQCSQVALGLAYADGIGVLQDYVEAHKWYNLAASRAKYANMRTDLVKRRDERGGIRYWCA